MSSRAFSYIFFFSLHLFIIYAQFFKSNHKPSNPMKFLNQLNKTQKVTHKMGVKELKKRLSYLGYMNTCPKNFINNHKNKNLLIQSCLETALKKYQEFYGLKTTGVLDDATVAKLGEPRCGVPDFYPTKKTLSFHQHYTFYSGHPKWGKKSLKYAFYENVKEEYIPPIEHAFQQWASVTQFTFTHANNFSEADIRIGFMPAYHGDGHPFINDQAGTLAHAFAPTRGEVHFNAAIKWSTDAAKGTHDVQTVGLHELGHALGLAHSKSKKAVMYPVTKPGERKGLYKDDIDGIKALYKL